MKFTSCFDTIVAIAILGIFSSSGLSQPEPSREPAVAERPAIGRYTITFAYAQPLPQWSPERLAEIPQRYHPRRRTRVEGAADGKIRREIRTWSDGVVTEGWVLPGITLFQNPSLLPEDIQIFEVDGPVVEGDDISKTFPELAWVSEASYRKRAAYKGRLLDHYSGTLPSSTIEAEAWIDPKTRLPVAARLGDETREYSFLAEAPAPLVLSPLFERYLENIRKLKSKPPGSV